MAARIVGQSEKLLALVPVSTNCVALSWPTLCTSMPLTMAV